MTKKKDSAGKPSRKKLTVLNSTQSWSPVKDIKDGVVLTKDGRLVQILEFSPINFLLRPEYEQINIADTFGAALKLFPNKFQIKILSRKASVESHVQDVLNAMKLETNEACRQMQRETIDLILNHGDSGVSKRFFLSYAYQQPAGIKKPSWNQIVKSLHTTAQQIASRLSGDPCGNELLTDLGVTDNAMDILYEIMNRSEAETVTMSQKVLDVWATYEREGRLDDHNRNIHINEIIAPQTIDPSLSPHYVVVDGKYHAYGYLSRNCYPLRAAAGWLSLLINMGPGVDVDIFVEKQPSDKIRQSLTRAMNWTQVDLSHKEDSAADIEEVANKLAAGKYIRQGLASDQEFMYFGIMLSIIANSEEELKQKVNWIQNALSSYELKLNMMDFRHLEGFKSALPLCSPDEAMFKYAARNILSADFGSAYPFTSYEINDKGGILFGSNLANYSPVFINQFSRHIYSNGNMAIFGSSGAGKSYMLQCLALRMRQQQVQTVIIAPYKGHEFRHSCASVGGQFISIAPGSPQNINIMEIRRHDIEKRKRLDGKDAVKGSILMRKVQQIQLFFSLLIKDITDMEKTELDEAILRAYKSKDITSNNKSLEDPKRPGHYKEMPILEDLARELEKKHECKRMRSVLSRFITGSLKNFNAHTNVNLNNPYIVIDVSELGEELLPIGILLATEFVSDAVQADRTKPKAVIWDELHRLVGPAGTPAAAKYVLQCWKLFRGYNAICICATQDSNDFLSGETNSVGRGILASSKLKVVMKVERMEAAALASILELSPIEEQNIQNFKRGQALLIANRNHADIQITASPREHQLITTDPSEIAARYEAE